MTEKIKEQLDWRLAIQLIIYIFLFGVVYATFNGEIERNKKDIQKAQHDMDMVKHDINIIKIDTREIKTILELKLNDKD